MFLAKNEPICMNALYAGKPGSTEILSIENGPMPVDGKLGNRRNSISEKVLELARQTLSNHFDDERYRYSLSIRWIPGSLVQLSEESILSVELVGEVERYTNFEVAYQQAGSVQTIQVQLALDIEKKLPVANRRIMYGEVLDSNSLNYRWISVSVNKGRLVESKNVLIGKTLRRTLTAGQPVRYADIASEFVIYAGDDVTLLFEKDGILIAITAQARQDGEMDEVITIYSNETRTRYLGRITNPGIAKWKKTL